MDTNTNTNTEENANISIAYRDRRDAQILLDFSRAISEENAHQQRLPFVVDTLPSYLTEHIGIDNEIELLSTDVIEIHESIEQEEADSRMPLYHFTNMFSDMDIVIIEDNPFRIDVFKKDEEEEDEDDKENTVKCFECPICLEEYEIKNACILQCNEMHRYCSSCTITHLEKSMNAYSNNPSQLQYRRSKPKCALCRENIQNITCFSNESEENIMNVLL